MPNEMTRPATTAAALPADFVSKLVTGIAQSHSQMRTTGGKPFLRLLKEGIWVYGADDTEVEGGSLWAVNVAEMKHGWSCWVDHGPGQKNTLEDEIMVSVLDHKPPMPPPLNGSPYKEQYSLELKCLDGEDAGTEVLYKISSVGGTRAFRDLTEAIMQRAQAGNSHIFPAIALEADHYNHTKHGRIYVPILTVKQWADVDGNLEEEATALPEPAPEPAPRRAQKAAAKPVPKAEAPVSTHQARSGQRRRPGR